MWWGLLLMPRNRLLSQIDEELLQARESLRFWRDQMIFLADTDYQVAATSHVASREAEVKRLLEAREAFHNVGRPTA